MADSDGENNCLVTHHRIADRLIVSIHRLIANVLTRIILISIVFFSFWTMSFQYYDSLSGDARSRYDKKLRLVGLNECPYRLPQGSWSNDPTKWPDMDYSDMFGYLIDTPGVFTRESMKNRKSLDAHNYFTSGWVETVYNLAVPNSRHMILTANVKPSQRVNDDPHRPWVALTTDGVVSSAHCNCMAGLGESCSHVGALLYKVEAAVRLGHTTRACTDVPCQWNNDFVKKVIPEPIHKIKFYNEARVEKAIKRTRRRAHPYTKSTVQEQQMFLQKLKESAAKPVGLSCFSGFSDGFHWARRTESNQLPMPLRKLYSADNGNMSETDLARKCKEVAANLTLSTEQAEHVNKATEKQSDCLQWYEQRCGRITSSVVHAVMHTSQTKPCRTVMKQICFPESVSSAAMRWGKDNEKKAVATYAEVVEAVQELHRNWSICSTGLQLSTENPFLAASADSIVNCECHGKRVLEVKCPYTHRQSNLQDFLSDKKCYIKDGQLQKNHKYYSQVQLQMYVYETDVCDFFVWTEKFCLLASVKRDNDFIIQMISQSQKFFSSHLLPEILTRRLENEPSPVMSSTANIKLYCICQKPEDNQEYIGCDNPTCPYEWLHLKCLNRKKAPHGTWYCPKCRPGIKALSAMSET